MAEVAAATQESLSAAHVLTPDNKDFEQRLEDVYLLDADSLSDGAVLYAGGAEAGEIAVFELAENTSPELVEDAMRQYVQSRVASFTGYFPQQAEIAKNSVIAVNGDHVALLICEDPLAAEEAFLKCFSEDPPALPEPAEPAKPAKNDSAAPVFKVITATPPEPEEPPDIQDEPEAPPVGDYYNRRAILSAWKSGDKSALSPKNVEILDICAKTISELITGGMSQLEKETAIHDWIAAWTEYDKGYISNEPDSEPHPESNNPYGALVLKRSICGGYAHTFQLFMDMLEIECITVRGTSWMGEEDHMWNMVRLEDGEWYCVDVTWNDTLSGREDAPVSHRYLNVTSEYMRSNDHQWNELRVPEATSERYM
jgi:hypothetical protein